MTYQEIAGMLEETGLSFAYHHFSESEAVDPPFLVFLFTGSDNMFADDQVYAKIVELHIELYTDRKDPALELAVENVLTAHDIPYEKEETYLESEKMYEVLYITEVYYAEQPE